MVGSKWAHMPSSLDLDAWSSMLPNTSMHMDVSDTDGGVVLYRCPDPNRIFCSVDLRVESIAGRLDYDTFGSMTFLLFLRLNMGCGILFLLFSLRFQLHRSHPLYLLTSFCNWGRDIFWQFLVSYLGTDFGLHVDLLTLSVRIVCRKHLGL